MACPVCRPVVNSCMTRSELMRRLVLNATCDDYENVDRIIPKDVRERGERLGLRIERAEVVNTLAGLVMGLRYRPPSAASRVLN